MQENVKAEIHLAVETICLFHNATLFFSPQRSQDGPVVKWLSDLRGRNKAQGAGADDVDEDMGTDNTKRPRRLAASAAVPRSEPPARRTLQHSWFVHVGGARASHCVFSLRAVREQRIGAQHTQIAAQSGEGIQSSVPSHFAASVALPPGICDRNHRSRLLQFWLTSRFSNVTGSGAAWTT